MMKSGEIDYMLKPMNCPHHVKIYAAKRSYRNLPLRLAEFGTVYDGNNPAKSQADSSLWIHPRRCSPLRTEDQLADEVLGCIELCKSSSTNSEWRSTVFV